MGKIVCEACGSNDLIKKDGVFVCQFCGMKYTADEVKKMAIEGKVDVSGSTVKVDQTEKLEKLYQLARRARDENNSDKAEEYYSQVLQEDPNSWEANFFTVYYQSMNCKIAGITTAANRLNNCLTSVFTLIYDGDMGDYEREATVTMVARYVSNISNLFFVSAKDNISNTSYDILKKYICEAAERCDAAINLVRNCGDKIIQFFGDGYGKNIAAPLWDIGNELSANWIHWIGSSLTGEWAKEYRNRSIEKIKGYSQKISKYDATLGQREYDVGSMTSERAKVACIVGFVFFAILFVVVTVLAEYW